MSHYYFKVVAEADGTWQARRGARVLGAYDDFADALNRAQIEVGLHYPSELIVQIPDDERLAAPGLGGTGMPATAHSARAAPARLIANAGREAVEPS